MRSGASKPPDSPASMASGEIEAVFLPAQGMLCASLCHRGEELLRCVQDLDQAAANGSMAGKAARTSPAKRIASSPTVVGEDASRLIAKG